MRSTRPRHLITETDPIREALDAAARRWPDERDNRTELLRRLVDEGRRALAEHEEQRRVLRLRAISATAGALTSAYPPSYLDELRGDWPT